jgi:L-gulono-1,4-lactone dehydrogenase
MVEWRNWAGDQRCVPARIERPRDRGNLIESVKRATDQGLTVRAVGAGHSFTDAACTGGVLLEMGELSRVLDVQRGSGLVKVEGGIGLRPLNELIWGHGMALENLGDIDKQTISGAVATGTHGTGARFRNLSWLIEAMELVLPDGTLLEVSPTSEPDLLPAVRVGLGALGVIATVTLRTVPAFSIRRTDSPVSLSETLERLQDLADGSEHFEFYVFPHTEVALLRQSERTDEPPDPRHAALEFGQEVVLENWVMGGIARVGRRFPSRIPRLSRFVSSQLGKSVKMDRSYRVFASRRMIRFTEMEYAIPRRHAAEAVPRVDAQPGARSGHLLHRGPPVPGDGLGELLPLGRGDHGLLRRASALGQAPLPDRRDARRALSALGGLPRRPRPARSGGDLPQPVPGPGARSPYEISSPSRADLSTSASASGACGRAKK